MFENAATTESLSSLLIIPPNEVQRFASPLREAYLSDHGIKGPAHITLFYPFVPVAELDTAAHKLQQLCQRIAAFEITLDHYNHFPTICYLEPHDPKPVLDLYEKISQVFPGLEPFKGVYGRELVPHLTLAAFEEANPIELPPAPCFTFRVDRLYLYYGPDECVPWLPHSVLVFGG